MDISTIDSFSNMFEKIREIIAVYFTLNFNTKNIKYMNHMFAECYFLTSINF